MMAENEDEEIPGTASTNGASDMTMLWTVRIATQHQRYRSRSMISSGLFQPLYLSARFSLFTAPILFNYRWLDSGIS
jgi:hypothetical protein